jgi:L-threonylcarbamoyladenylate synthase
MTPRKAAALLRQGEVVALPTETVYGLAANAFNAESVAKIYALKGRPAHNPLIVHVRDAAHAQTLVAWSPLADLLAKAFWPAALTLVLPKRSDAPLVPAVTAGQDTVAVRCPAHPLMQEVLSQLDVPLAAPSANPSGCISPTKAAHVHKYWPDLPLLDGGACAAGLESTIVAIQGKAWTILREGTLTHGQLEAVIGTPPCALPNAPIVPGQDARHYAPRLPLRLNAQSVQADEGLIAFGVPLQGAAVTINVSARGDVTEAAMRLYDALHQLDAAAVRAIAVMPIPNTGIGVAINNRLARASHSGLHHIS